MRQTPHVPGVLQRALSRVVASYPPVRGHYRLRHLTRSWLVACSRFGPWLRVSGLTDFEWELLAGKEKEPATCEFLLDYLQPGMTVVDVGANIGYFTLLSATKVGASGRIVAYEPTPRIAARLRENVELNRSAMVEVVEAAVSDRESTMTFYESPEDPEANNLYHGGSPVTVRAVKLDEDLSRRGVERVHLLKIDAEGAEVDVLAGARELLRSCAIDAILVEANPVTLRSAGKSCAELRAVLQSFGYSCHTIDTFSYHDETVWNWLATRTQMEQGNA